MLWSIKKFLLDALSHFTIPLELIIWRTCWLFLMLSSIILLISKYKESKVTFWFNLNILNFLLRDTLSFHKSLSLMWRRRPTFSFNLCLSTQYSEISFANGLIHGGLSSRGLRYFALFLLLISWRILFW